MAISDITVMVEDTISGHINLVGTLAFEETHRAAGELAGPPQDHGATLMQNGKGEWLWSQLKDLIEKWSAKCTQVYHEANNNFSAELKRLIAKQDASPGTALQQQAEWIGYVANTLEQGGARAGARKRKGDAPQALEEDQEGEARILRLGNGPKAAPVTTGAARRATSKHRRRTPHAACAC